MTTITITAEAIAKLEAAGFNRWTKNGMDRLYVNAETLGLEADYYKTGNVRKATWQGESISNADARRLMSSKVWIDVKTGELHVRTDYYNGIDEDMTLESVASAYVEGIVAEEEEEEEEETIDLSDIDYSGATILDEDEDTGETLYAVTILTGDTISVIVDESGEEYFNDDWQSNQPKSFREIRDGDWRWYRGDELNF